MPEVEKAREVLALMRAGAIDGLSIGFRTVRGRTDAKSGVRQLIEVDLWEISVVTFPMLPAARVSAVKGMRRGALIETIRRGTRMMRGRSLTLGGEGRAGGRPNERWRGRRNPSPNPSPQGGGESRRADHGLSLDHYKTGEEEWKLR